MEELHLFNRISRASCQCWASSLHSIESALAGRRLLFRLLSLVLASPLWRFWPADTGSFARFASAVRATASACSYMAKPG